MSNSEVDQLESLGCLIATVVVIGSLIMGRVHVVIVIPLILSIPLMHLAKELYRSGGAKDYSKRPAYIEAPLWSGGAYVIGWASNWII